MNLDSNVIVQSRDIEFIENKFSLDFTFELEYNIDEPCDFTPSTSTYNKKKESMTSFEPRRSQCKRKEKGLAFLVKGDRNSILNKISLLLDVEEDLKTFNEATSSRDASF